MKDNIEDVMEINVKGLSHIDSDKLSVIRNGIPATDECKLMNYLIEIISDEIRYKMKNGVEFDIEFKDR